MYCFISLRTNSRTYLGQIELHFDLKKRISSTLSHSFPFHSSHSSRCSFLTPATHSRASKGGGELEPSISSTSSLGRLPTHLPPLPLTVLSPPAASSQQPAASHLNNSNYFPTYNLLTPPTATEIKPNSSPWSIGLGSWYLLLSLPSWTFPSDLQMEVIQVTARMSPSQRDFPNLKQPVNVHPLFHHFLYRFIF